jgi:hypothetical protein
MKNDKKISLLKKAGKIIIKPYILISLLAVLSACVSYAAEKLRVHLGIGAPEFSFVAFAGLGLLIFIVLNLASGAGVRKFDICDRRQMLLFGLTALFCAVICFSAVKNLGESTVYPMTKAQIEGGDPYVQQFDALQKGQIELDIPVSGELAAMENPYDRDARDYYKVQYFWDRAFYNGKYYSYFGLAPIFCVYYPYYAITGSLPPSDTVCFILAVFTVLTLSLSLIEFLILADAKPKLWLVLLSLVSLAFGSGIYTAQSYADIYYIPVLSAMGFNYAAFFFAFRACRTEKKERASALFALASLSFVMSVMSRPTASLMCAAAAPAVIERIFIKTRGAGQKAVLFVPAALVACAGAAVVMTFNFLRFGSPFDFGANYQLTVCDISKNTLELRLAPYAFFHYVFQMPKFMPAFPFVKPSYLNLDYGRYMYLDYSTGLLFFPATLGLVIGPFFSRFKAKEWSKYSTFIAGAAVICFVIFVDFCKAGVNLRYLYDFLPLAATFGTVLFLRAAKEARSGWARALVSAFAAACFIGTIIMSLGVISANGADRLFMQFRL